ncbi:hypothetical protein AQUCO_03400379v1 [Aquilegia coerulea]|uniref:RING-type E3 ubiquitin transferase n=1 Tax=Aquilegia coerulea TaxID=218851 RepID=A0A2G5CYV6_AQUCA|nr:hypothetical protein AQUCO_03400379v1 [Aquilegia coerulea]
MESNLYHYELQALPPMRSQHQEIYTTHQSHSSSQASFPILALAIIGILTTAFLLVGYYVFAIKCCLNSHRIDIFSPFFISRSRRRGEALIVYASSATENRGLDELAIRSIPILHFNKTELQVDQRDLFECAVCLNEFQDEEKLRMLPSCTHIFHIDCIDIWLQNNANCPLCRSSISISTPQPPSTNHTFSPTSPHEQSVISGDQDFVVIEVRNGADQVEQATHRRQETANSDISSISPSPRKTEQKVGNKKAMKFNHVSSMGDECINVRAKDDQFSVQPIRRSISMDSSADRQLFLSIQEIIQHNRNLNEVNSSEDCSSSSSTTSISKLRRSSFFSFGHGRGSRSASVLPIQFEQEN